MYDTIISLKNIYEAWSEFVIDKKNKNDIAEFALHVSDNILQLHNELKNKTYIHSGYKAFAINDPKPRDIHKAKVRDRLLHHAIYRVLYPMFDKKFIFDSYSCRNEKGTHKAVTRFRKFALKVSKNNSQVCWVLKCDIRKFFASVNHEILLNILKKFIFDGDVLWLLEKVIKSFHSTEIGKGLPLGNLTSQLLVNIYMNEFDQYMKHDLKIKYYVRYADDFLILNDKREKLETLLILIDIFLKEKLSLNLHPDKVYIKTFASGVDFLGWVNFFDHKVLRTTIKRRMFRNIKLKEGKVETVQSYLGMLKHGNAFELSEEIKKVTFTL